MAAKSDKKLYVLDTSPIVNDWEAINSFEDNDLVIPLVVIEELDHLKKSPNPIVASSARRASRLIENYIIDSGVNPKTAFTQGVPKHGGGRLYVDFSKENWDDLRAELDKSNDNRIILVALHWQKKGYKEVVLVSKDVNLRLKARVQGVMAEDYRHDQVVTKIEELYSGVITIPVKEEHVGIFNSFYTETEKKGGIPESELIPVMGTDLLQSLEPNQFCIFSGETKHVLAIYKKEARIFRSVPKPKDLNIKKDKICPRNDRQAMARYALSDPSIELVALSGIAGTGKTLLSLEAAYRQFLKGEYKKIIIYRPTTEYGRELGFTPGDIDEKFRKYTDPIFENMALIVPDEDIRQDGMTYKDSFMDAVDSGRISIQPINFILGSTKHNTYIIAEEVQNLTAEETKALITRAGQGTKVVLNGDLSQINNRYLDPFSNGLARAFHRLKGQDIFACVELLESERSKLAGIAASLM